MDVIPRVDASDDKVPFQTILDLYETHRCVHVVNAAAAARPRQGRWLSEIARLERLGHAAGTFNVENDAATALTHEALVRQSQDNIGVCVIDLRNRSG